MSEIELRDGDLLVWPQPVSDQLAQVRGAVIKMLKDNGFEGVGVTVTSMTSITAPVVLRRAAVGPGSAIRINHGADDPEPVTSAPTVDPTKGPRLAK